MLAAYNPFALKNLRLLGRAGDKRPLHLYWTGSGLEMDLRARELWVELEADYADLEPWISLMVNGRLVLRQMLPKGRHWLPLLRGLDPDKPHHIYLLKESQAMPTDPDSGILVHALRFDGELAPLPEPACRLEFIGDSLTSAEGGMGGPEDSEWRPIWFAGALGYPWTAARLLGGEARVLSQSGWGARSSWDNDPGCNLPAYYEQVCGVVPEGGLGGDHAAYDFASWKPDAVLCALGANDLGAMGNPARVDPKTGESFRQSREDTAPLLEAMTAFLDKLRRCNPDAKIYWLLFGQREPLNELAQTAVQRHCAYTGDARCGWIELAPMAPTGARNHPGLDLHQAQAKALAEKLRALL